MFSHTSPPNPAPGPTSVRKHCLFLFSWFFSMFFCFCLCFYWFFYGSGSFLIDFIGFSMVFIGFTMVLDSFHWFLLVFQKVLLGFGWAPLVFHCFFGFRIDFERKTKGKLLENQSQPTPGPLRSFLLGLSLLCLSLLRDSFSGTPPESLLVVWAPPGSSGWLWPPPSSLCLLLRVIRKKSDSGASPELPSGHLPPLSLWAPLAGSGPLLPLSVFFHV